MRRRYGVRDHLRVSRHQGRAAKRRRVDREGSIDKKNVYKKTAEQSDTERPRDSIEGTCDSRRKRRRPSSCRMHRAADVSVCGSRARFSELIIYNVRFILQSVLENITECTRNVNIARLLRSTRLSKSKSMPQKKPRRYLTRAGWSIETRDYLREWFKKKPLKKSRK